MSDAKIDHAKLREIATKATPGPWTTKAERQRPRAIIAAGTEQIADAAEHTHWTDAQIERNAAFIAASSPDVVLALLDDNEKLTAELLAARWADETRQKAAQAAIAERDAAKAEVERLRRLLVEVIRKLGDDTANRHYWAAHFKSECKGQL